MLESCVLGGHTESKDWKHILEIKTDRKKQEEMILLIAEGMARRPNFGKTVLAKMMYFSETNSFLETGKPIAGTIFIKEKYGPLPKDFDKILERMKKEGSIQIVRIKGSGDTRERTSIMPLREPRRAAFTQEEINTINSVIERLNVLSATQIKDYSHKDVAWMWTEMLHEIDYRLAAYRNIKTM